LPRGSYSRRMGSKPLGGEMDRVIGDIIILVVIGLWIASRLFV